MSLSTHITTTHRSIYACTQLRPHIKVKCWTHTSHAISIYNKPTGCSFLGPCSCCHFPSDKPQVYVLYALICLVWAHSQTQSAPIDHNEAGTVPGSLLLITVSAVMAPYCLWKHNAVAAVLPWQWRRLNRQASACLWSFLSVWCPRCATFCAYWCLLSWLFGDMILTSFALGISWNLVMLCRNI